jgi:hypothetical protein
MRPCRSPVNLEEEISLELSGNLSLRPSKETIRVFSFFVLVSRLSARAEACGYIIRLKTGIPLQALFDAKESDTSLDFSIW